MADKKKTLKKDMVTESDKDVKTNTDVKHDKNVKDIKYDEIAKHYKEKYNLAFSQFQRLQADFDNYRKRVSKEKLDIGNHAKEQILMPVLEAIDNLERAVESSKTNDDIVVFKEGIELTLKQLKDTLAKEGLSEIVSVGEKFDPAKHEALITTESSEHEDDMVFSELQKGYLFKDKVIRPTKVKVVKNS